LASLVRRVSAWPEDRRAFAGQLVGSARGLAAALQTLEAGLGELRRDLAADEAQRLADKLGALGPALQTEPAERRELRGLLTRQLDLVRGLELRIAEAEQEHQRLGARLKRIWELSRSVDESPSLEVRPLLEQLERLCAEPSAETEPMTRTRGN
jgi:hypothetical protein